MSEIVQGTYETFVAMAKQHFSGDAKGKWVLTGGLGGMGGAQPLAATMAGFSALVVECDESRIDFRIKTGYVDVKATDLEHALKLITDACVKGKALSVGLLGNAADVFSTLVKSGITPDIVTDQTSAHDPLNGYLPQGWSMEHAAKMRIDNPQAVVDHAEAAKTPFDEPFQTLITEGAWGTVWADDAITHRERSMLTLALLAATGNFEEIPMHIRATANTGASRDDVMQADRKSVV